MAQLKVSDFARIASEYSDKESLSAVLRLVLENGQMVSLKENYMEQVWNAIHGTNAVDTAWLQCTMEEVFFVTRANTKLALVLASDTDVRSDSNIGSEVETMHIVLDQSSSMQNIQTSVYEGARELVEQLPDHAHVIFTTFSTRVQIGSVSSKNDMLNSLLTQRIASGSTCLYDAIVQAINASLEFAGRVTLVVVTDGQDTCSHECNENDVRMAIQRFKENQMRNILFLGSNQDAIVSARAFGIPMESALTVGVQGTHMRNAFRSVSDNVTRVRTGQGTGFLATERQVAVRT
jgi:hypothetical protein